MKQPILINDSFQNFRSYQLPKAQLIIADVPYNLGNNAYASNPAWYNDGDNQNGESELAGKQFFNTDSNFRPAEFMHFCSHMLRKKPKVGISEEELEKAPKVGGKLKSQSPCMILFCAFDQLHYFIDLGKRYGLMRNIPLVFRKNYSAQVLKANMKIVGNCEYGLLLYRDRLPKFNNNGNMVFNCFEWPRETRVEKIHPCLPAGEKVYINDQWVNIEDVKVGDYSKYGKVIDTTSHFADKMVRIETEDGVINATWNHPFLVLRDNEIAWVHAELIKPSDKILWRKDVRKHESQHQRGIFGLEQGTNAKWSMFLFGKNILAKCLTGIKSIILMETNRTIELKISSLSQPLSTSGFTKVANLSWMNGISHVQYADSINDATKNTGISPVDGLQEQSVKSAMSKRLSPSVKFVLRTVGSVRITNQKTRMYNLTISGTPAFDTVIGCSHNTQKPIALLERLIELFTDPEDVVIDPVAGSGSTLLAAANLNRKAYGFEIDKGFYRKACKFIENVQPNLFSSVI